MLTSFIAADVQAIEGLQIRVGNVDTEAIELTGAAAKQQLVAHSIDSTAKRRDVTHAVQWTVKPAGILSIDQCGYVSPLNNGTAVVAAKDSVGNTDTLSVIVSDAMAVRPVSFPNDVVPQLTRAGCNGGACHGTPKGKNNFRLSLLGFEPRIDHEFLTRESRGRRLFPGAPERSLLLQKACGDLPHGGGIRIKKSSEGYAILRRWISEGAGYSPINDAAVIRIAVFPENAVVDQLASQQLVVTAYLSDGTIRDVTRVAEYKVNQPGMCDVDHHGRIRFHEIPGTTSVMVRFQEFVGAFLATIPLNAPMPDLKEPDNYVDRLVNRKLKTLGLPPSEQCDDSTFLRRVSLDVAGKLPKAQQTLEFLNSKDNEKRKYLIDRLLETTGYADVFANKWSGILRNKAGGNLEQVARETYGFHAWIRAGLLNNKPFDRFATELITARGSASTNPAVSWYRAVSNTNDRMADIAQVFLGVRIQCAQCHHHPYEKWSQDDYHGFAAFFSTLARKEVRKRPEEDSLYHRRILAVAKNPANDRELRPTPLDSEPLDIPPERDPRQELAKWVTSSSNPFFAKMVVNRYWKHFFSRGLVEPEDDIRVTNPSTHPELLRRLADSFTESGYDLKQLCRTICNTDAYQRSAIPNDHNGSDEQNFARYYPARLDAEILLDAINDVAGARNNFNRQPVGVRAIALPDDAANTESFFLRVFGRPQMDTACECERTTSADLAQSLHLLSSDAMQGILGDASGRATTISQQKDRDDKACLENLYLDAFCRKPTTSELHTAMSHVQKKIAQSEADPSTLSSSQAIKEAYEDIIWVVVNTKEFLFNH